MSHNKDIIIKQFKTAGFKVRLYKSSVLGNTFNYFLSVKHNDGFQRLKIDEIEANDLAVQSISLADVDYLMRRARENNSPAYYQC
jgi:hypothetical protein